MDFRQNSSTIDQIVQIEDRIVNGFEQRMYAVAVFFDLEKAYDTIYRHSII